MKRMKQVGIFVAGFTTAIIIFFGANSVWASSLFTSIYVNFSQIKIFIDGQERNPPADMKPFVYEGRTYVSLRYVGEAFGKKVDWDQATRSVIITEPRAQLTQYYESFADAKEAGKYWVKRGGDTWKFDGPNGLLINKTGVILLHDVLPDSYSNYTVEFDALMLNRYLTTFCLGKDNEGVLGDVFTINYDGLYYREKSSDDGYLYGSNKLATLSDVKKLIRTDEFARVKIQVKDRYANIYLNNELVVTKEILMPKSAFAFSGANGSFYSQNHYIKNFSLIIN